MCIASVQLLGWGGFEEIFDALVVILGYLYRGQAEANPYSRIRLPFEEKRKSYCK